MTARRGGANEMEPERMRLVTELPGFDDRRGARSEERRALLCDGRLGVVVADGRELSSELIGREVAARELSGVLTF